VVWTRQHIRLRPSNRLVVYLVSIHAITGASCVATPVPSYLKVVLLIAVVASLVHGLRRHALLLSSKSVTALTLGRDGVWSLALGDGRLLEATLRPGALIHPRLMVLGFRCEQWGTSVVLAGDNADRDQVRRLRVRLRLSGIPGGDQVRDIDRP